MVCPLSYTDVRNTKEEGGYLPRWENGEKASYVMLLYLDQGSPSDGHLHPCQHKVGLLQCVLHGATLETIEKLELIPNAVVQARMGMPRYVHASFSASSYSR